MTLLEKIIAKYEALQYKLITDLLKNIAVLFDESATNLAFLFAKRQLLKNKELPPDIKNVLNVYTRTASDATKKILLAGIKNAWELADKKNTEIEKLIGFTDLKKPVETGPKGGVYTSASAYIKRKNQPGGLGLSKRVFKLSQSYKKVMNDTLIEGLQKGTSAAELGRKLRGNLRNNKKIEDPGQGVYKSPRKNAERLTRSEINMANASADQQRWQSQWFVIGIEVRLSASHPKYDICDPFAGKYPKDFIFNRWHPQCLCVAIPILATQEQRDEMLDYQLGLTDKPPKIKYITKLPPDMVAWVKLNAGRISGWKSQPYWKTQNTNYLGKYFTKKK